MTAATLPSGETHARREAGTEVVAAAVVFVGVAVLLVRPFVAGSAGARAGLLATAYLAIAVAAIAVPADGRRAAPIAVGTAAAVGIAAIAAVALAGRTVPVPWGAGALPLALLAAVAEEALFRRVAFSRLERFGPAVAVIGSAALFALVHVPAYGISALPVDVGAGLLFGWQRWASGTWLVPAWSHLTANLLAVLR